MTDLSEPNQSARDQEVRLILERTLALAHETGNLQRTADSSWQYIGQQHSLIYHAESDSLWLQANDGNWQLGYHEQAFLPGHSAAISDEQLQEFQELQGFLDEQHIPQTVDLRSLSVQAKTTWEQEHHIQPDEQDQMSATAAQLFEQYVEQGIEAYKESPSSQVWMYRVMVDDAVYRISRDDATLTYHLQREDEQPLSRTDLKTWNEIDTWLNHQQPVEIESLADPGHGWQGTYWEQQTIRANAILPIAEQLFAHTEQLGTLHLDEVEQHYCSRIGEYSLGYAPGTDTFWIDRNDGTHLVSATNWHDHCDQNRWQFQGLDHLGMITPDDIQQFQNLQTWLHVKHPEWEATAKREQSLLDKYRHYDNQQAHHPTAEINLQNSLSTAEFYTPSQTPERL